MEIKDKCLVGLPGAACPRPKLQAYKQTIGSAAPVGSRDDWWKVVDELELKRMAKKGKAESPSQVVRTLRRHQCGPSSSEADLSVKCFLFFLACLHNTV